VIVGEGELKPVHMKQLNHTTPNQPYRLMTHPQLSDANSASLVAFSRSLKLAVIVHVCGAMSTDVPDITRPSIPIPTAQWNAYVTLDILDSGKGHVVLCIAA
jgi:hypothetical protein